MCVKMLESEIIKLNKKIYCEDIKWFLVIDSIEVKKYVLWIYFNKVVFFVVKVEYINI